jgi:DNA-binding transcriptional MerR regulator
MSAAAGVSVETIRYYQRRGLLEEPKKPLGGHRNYPTEIVKRIRFIERAQALGFTLEDVAGLLQLNNTMCQNPRPSGTRAGLTTSSCTRRPSRKFGSIDKPDAVVDALLKMSYQGVVSPVPLTFNAHHQVTFATEV